MYKTWLGLEFEREGVHRLRARRAPLHPLHHADPHEPGSESGNVPMAADERLRVTFSNIDPQAPTRAFTFQVYVDTTDRYHGARLAFLPTRPTARAAPLRSSPRGLPHVPSMSGRRPCRHSQQLRARSARRADPGRHARQLVTASGLLRGPPATPRLATAAVPCHVGSLPRVGQAAPHANANASDAFLTHPGSTAPTTSARSSAACERASSFS